MKKLLLLLFTSLAIWACMRDEGELKPNSAPDTSIFLDSINLSGEDRLTSVVSIFWIGTDKDGFVERYELSFDAITWFETTATDTTFKFVISEGSDTSNIDFYVRAIDNNNNVDPEPAYLNIPIKNTAPTIILDEDFLPADTSNIIFSLIWNVFDLDGQSTLDSTFIKINEGGWFPVAANRNAARFVPVNTNATGDVELRVLSSRTQSPAFTINNEREELGTISGFKLNENNTIYVRTRDLAGVFSEVDTSNTFYTKNKNSDFLMIDSHFDENVRTTYGNIFNNLNAEYDFINLFENDADENIRFWNFNFPLLIQQYDRIFWYSSNETFSSGTLLLEIAINGLQPYLDEGGKVIISTALTGDANQDSPVFNFAPIDSISPKVGTSQARYVNGSKAWPEVAGYDSLTCTANIANAAPFHNSQGSEVLFKSSPLKLNGWEGPEVIGAKVGNTNGQTNLIFFSVELHKFNGNPQGLQTMFNKVLNEEFNW